ncbi:MAG: GntR family transcriptional regulator [Actinobacteria bacterium]|nr:GntR family transcriptional regulator [Actinomycetota bacterium]
MSLTDADQAYSLLKERIITTEMRPGSVIDEATLMAELHLGRTPIREACKRLEVERLVVVLPRRGMYVAEVTLSELRELEEVRLELETLSARLAVVRITPAQLDDIRHLLEEVAVCLARPRGSQDDILEIDRRLHGLLWQASQNSLLEADCKRLHDYSLRMWYLLVDRLEAAEVHEEFFADIAAAVSTQDQQRADQAMRNHILQFGDAIRRHI